MPAEDWWAKRQNRLCSEVRCQWDGRSCVGYVCITYLLVGVGNVFLLGGGCSCL
jgi:hypothetical protein